MIGHHQLSENLLESRHASRRTQGWHKLATICHLARVFESVLFTFLLVTTILVVPSYQDDVVTSSLNVSSNQNKESIKIGTTKNNNYNIQQTNYGPAHLTQLVFAANSASPRFDKNKMRLTRPPTQDEFAIKQRILDVYNEAVREFEQHQELSKAVHLQHLGRILAALNPKYIATARVRRAAFADPSSPADELVPLPEYYTRPIPVAPLHLNSLEADVGVQLDRLLGRLGEQVTWDDFFTVKLVESDTAALSPNQLALRQLLLCLEHDSFCPTAEQQRQQQQQLAAMTPTQTQTDPLTSSITISGRQPPNEGHQQSAVAEAAASAIRELYAKPIIQGNRVPPQVLDDALQRLLPPPTGRGLPTGTSSKEPATLKSSQQQELPAGAAYEPPEVVSGEPAEQPMTMDTQIQEPLALRVSAPPAAYLQAPQYQPVGTAMASSVATYSVPANQQAFYPPQYVEFMPGRKSARRKQQRQQSPLQQVAPTYLTVSPDEQPTGALPQTQQTLSSPYQHPSTTFALTDSQQQQQQQQQLRQPLQQQTQQQPSYDLSAIGANLFASKKPYPRFRDQLQQAPISRLIPRPTKQAQAFNSVYPSY